MSDDVFAALPEAEQKKLRDADKAFGRLAHSATDAIAKAANVDLTGSTQFYRSTWLQPFENVQ